MGFKRLLFVVGLVAAMAVPTFGNLPDGQYDLYLMRALRQYRFAHPPEYIIANFVTHDILEEISVPLILDGRATLERPNLSDYDRLKARFQIRLGLLLNRTGNYALCIP